ncbi:hypothetical protein LCGC14_1108200 [marine sediment metagenome]|uniref:Uncharacterized protein n=1 Tax=marine sediment metagenome TaxID=412755 RepID=A0A0F9MVF6_9ZZZZ
MIKWILSNETRTLLVIALFVIIVYVLVISGVKVLIKKGYLIAKEQTNEQRL